jgi:hypothetical integral membrane protein (TIGR02206 family)
MMVSIPRFTLFGAQHVTVLLILLTLSCLMVGAKRWRWMARPYLSWTLASLLLAYAAAIYFQEAVQGKLHASYSLPMQFCDWVLIACLIALLRPCLMATEIAYFWGLGGTLQAVLTPDITQGFPSWRFVEFFWGHGAILVSIIYLVASRDFRPRLKSILRMMIALNIYGLTALALDLAFGWNYGYLRSKPAGASLFDYLGPWPWYLLSIELIAPIIFLLLCLPWIISDRLRPGTDKAAS